MCRLIALFNRLERQMLAADEAVTIAGERARNGMISRAKGDVLHIAALVAKADRTAPCPRHRSSLNQGLLNAPAGAQTTSKLKRCGR